MTDWEKDKIDLKDLWKNKEERGNDIDWNKAGKIVAQRIRIFKLYSRYPRLETLAKRFDNVKTQKGFDRTMNALWDFGDDNKIWITTVV